MLRSHLLVTVLSNRGDAYPYVNAEARAYVAAMTVKPDDAVKALIDDTVGDLKSASLWTKLSILTWLRIHDEQAGRLNMVNPGQNTLTPIGSSPTFTAWQGFRFSGSNCFTTGFNPLAAGLPKDTCAFAIDLNDNIAENGAALGARTGANDDAIQLNTRTASDLANWGVNSDGTDSVASTDSSGCWLIRRTSASGVGATSVYREGSALSNSTRASSNRPNLDIYVGAINSGGSATGNVTNEAGMFGIFNGILSSGDVTAFQAIVAAWRSATAGF